MSQQWDDILWDLICLMWKFWGGKCEDMPPKGQSKELVSFMWNVFITSGPPDLSAPGERDRFLKLLSDLEAHLNDPDNDLDPYVDASLRAWIKTVRDSVKP